MKEYIEREALMNAFRSHMAEKFDKKRCVSEENCLTCDMRCMWHRVVTKAPAADVVERKRGEWVRDNQTLVHCSVCKVARNANWETTGSLWNFCPNCGSQNGGCKE